MSLASQRFQALKDWADTKLEYERLLQLEASDTAYNCDARKQELINRIATHRRTMTEVGVKVTFSKP